MWRDGQNKNRLEQHYIELYRCMIDEDLLSLSDILDSSFVLAHMTGMQQDKQSFLNYYAVTHEAVTRLQIQFVNRNRKWMIGRTVASTY